MLKPDAFGITASSLCAIHCVATPLAVSLLPAVAGEAWESPLVHQLCAVFVTAFCLAAAIQGYRRHGDYRPLIPFALGLSIVIGATFFLPGHVHHSYEMPTLVAGSLILVLGHVLNYRKAEQCCTPAHDLAHEADAPGLAGETSSCCSHSAPHAEEVPVLVDSVESDK